MPRVVKNSQPKKALKIKRVASVVADEEEKEPEPVITKSKKGSEIDLIDPVVPDVLAPIIPEEKPDDEDAAATETDELAAEEPTLDEEDLNPFGDKWEE